jgi:transmembrane sensor
MSTEQLTAARQVRAQAAEWLERRVANDWREDDQAALDAWLAAASTNRIAYLRVQGAWNKADRLAALKLPMPKKAAPPVSAAILPVFLRLAAAFGLVAMIGLAALNLVTRSQAQTFATAVGGHKLIKLQDGSSIELNTDTSIAVSITADSRTVRIVKGEVYFQVHHSAARPFVVYAQGHRITDLGTKFLVRTHASGLEVALISGSARLDTPGAARKKSVLLKPGEIAVTNVNALSVTREPLDEIVDQLAWRRGMLVFRHVTLAEAAAEFNRYNARKLVIADDIAGLKINGTFAKGSLDAFSRTAQYALGLHVASLDREIVLSR